MLKESEVVQQSKAALAQWGDQWRDHARIHSGYKMRPFDDLANVGVGKALLLVGNGYSLEENIDTIKKHRSNIDIMACDKTLGHLIDNGIKPDYVMVCDANVNYEKYLEPYKDDLYKTILFMNVAGNPKWTHEKWKKTYFFVNQDSIKSEVEFCQLSGCTNLIPAATNVSGAMVVLATQSTNQGRNNYFGYDKLVLIGFDYSWREGGKYYAFDQGADGKNNYMRHLDVILRSGEMAYTSHNLMFSSRWITDYIKGFRMPVVSGSDRTIVQGIPCNSLDSELQYRYKADDAPKVIRAVRELADARLRVSKLTSMLNDIGKDHWSNFQESI